jgi:hypothetical protein
LDLLRIREVKRDLMERVHRRSALVSRRCVPMDEPRPWPGRSRRVAVYALASAGPVSGGFGAAGRRSRIH